MKPAAPAHAHAGHHHAPASFGPAFLIGTGLNAAFVVVELIYGLLSGSLALISDAGHNASDVLGLLIAYAAYLLARRRPSAHFTYGLRRGTVLASLVNAALLLAAVAVIAWEALHRLAAPEAVQGGTVIWVAAVGIAVNAATAALFASGRRADLNLRGVFQHMAADALVSAAVVLSGALILWTGWTWLDPAVSLLVAGVIAVGTWGLLRDSLRLSVDAVPPGIDPQAVRTYLAGLPGVSGLHDLHIWPLSTTETALSAHLVRPDGGRGADPDFYRDLQRELHDRFGIEHATVQVEAPGQRCALAAEGSL